MNIIVATSTEPFVSGGASLLADWLSTTLRAHGHSVEPFPIPFSYRHPVILQQMTALRLLDLHDSADRLIAIRPPSYLLRHPNKVVWFIHHHRAAYDLWGTRYSDFPDSPEGRCYRDAIHSADDLGLGEAQKIFTNSKVTGDRLLKFNGLGSEVLYPPLFEGERYHCREYGEYVLYVSRLLHHKRQWLAIESLAKTKSPVRLILAGKPGAPGEGDALRELAEKRGVADRVTILSGWISEEEKIELFADCLAALYFPVDEDSYGYPSLEAHHAQKCVITTGDSGGTTELISDGENGLVTAPEPAAIAAAIDRLYWDRGLARSLGRNGPPKLASLGINWDRVVEKLLQ
jgi:glycosyltransferase involved in cell wall biosynthesis